MTTIHHQQWLSTQLLHQIVKKRSLDIITPSTSDNNANVSTIPMDDSNNPGLLPQSLPSGDSSDSTLDISW
jgi:hypothetical protein